jgi:hypothetical protein
MRVAKAALWTRDRTVICGSRSIGCRIDARDNCAENDIASGKEGNRGNCGVLTCALWKRSRSEEDAPAPACHQKVYEKCHCQI